MKKTVWFVITVLMIVIFSCKKESNEYYDRIILISYIDSTGKSLLDTTNVNALKYEDIDLYYLVDGKKQQVYDSNMDIPEGFKFTYYTGLNKNVIEIHLNDNMDKNDVSETYIDFGNRMDTIRAEFNVHDNGYDYEKIWYNGELKIDRDTSDSDYFEITLD